jgi:hypothetical protein
MDGDDPQKGQELHLQYEWLRRLLLHTRHGARKKGSAKIAVPGFRFLPVSR